MLRGATGDWASSRSATRSRTAAASSSGGWRCSPGRCGWRAVSGCRSPATRPTGRRSRDVVDAQIPACLARSPAGARYELGCLYIGVNDVRSVDWDPVEFAALFRTALGFLHERCDRVLTVTAPLDLGRPRAGAKVGDLDEVIFRVAGELGALVVDLRSWGARNLVMTDHVHPDRVRADRHCPARPGRAGPRRDAGRGRRRPR